MRTRHLDQLACECYCKIWIPPSTEVSNEPAFIGYVINLKTKRELHLINPKFHDKFKRFGSKERYHIFSRPQDLFIPFR